MLTDKNGRPVDIITLMDLFWCLVEHSAVDTLDFKVFALRLLRAGALKIIPKEPEKKPVRLIDWLRAAA